MQSEPLEEEQLRQRVTAIVEAPEELQNPAAESWPREPWRIATFHGGRLHVGSQGDDTRSTLQVFSTGPWGVINDDRDHLHIVQNIVTGKTRDVRVARIHFYSDEQLQVTSCLQDIFQHLEH